MQKVKAFLGYFIAFLGVPIVLATFMGNQFFSEALVKATGLEVSPWIIGGELQETLPREGYRTLIYAPVFMGLIGETNEGFIQIAWSPAANLPENISEEFDVNKDGKMDFKVTLNTREKTGTLDAYSADVISMEGPFNYKTKDTLKTESLAVRVTIKRALKP
ncbi:MAG TPA: hypothetical protein PKW33_05725 [Anaerolineaceae bacterium]|nr:hypothetical protein [Anaerolineaceae bacterium]HPN51066.1 hypothetical protein [Anaerolineaceae bacterium]